MSFIRGWFGERITAFNLWLNLDKKNYSRYKNLIVPSINGTTQIDHAVVSPFGIFIVETKNIKGWIFGSERQPDWTQVLYGNKYQFQNPLRQTFRQKRILAEHLGVDESLIHTVVFFVGNCTFKTNLPPNVLRFGPSGYLKRFSTRVLSDESIATIRRKLEALLSDKSLTTESHLASLRERHGSRTVCPRCGGNLVVRTARNHPHAGSKFLGCRNYPRCRFTRSIDL